MFNAIILEGRLTRDLEYMQLKNNTDPNRVGCKFSIAHDYKKGSVLFFDCVYFGIKGITPWLKKGSAVIIRGKLEYNDYTDRQGQQRRAYSVLVEDVSFSMSNCGNGNNQQANSPFGSQQTPNYQQRQPVNQYQQAPSQQYQQAPSQYQQANYQQQQAPSQQYQQAPNTEEVGDDTFIPF